tara:strand:+ start:195 stop:1700 length:1506 start_codon:yes stop_codon:yes gene_type:complete
MSNAEIIDLSTLDENPVITLNKSNSTPFIEEISTPKSKQSVNFGGGIELLMNDKRKQDDSLGASGDINLDDLNDLEDELNDLTEPVKLSNIKVPSKSGLFNSDIASEKKTFKPTETFMKINKDPEQESVMPDIGKNTADFSNADNKGPGFFGNVPIDPDAERYKKPNLSPEELLREKFSILRKLEALEKKGVSLTKKYSMDSSLEEMQGEYELIISEKEKSNSIKFQGRMLMAAITGVEFLNNKFDPFDVKLDGWSEQINENIDDYDEIFGELHEKYKSKAKMAPELKLLFQLGGSAIMVHMTNSMFKSSIPGMDDIMRQNPELAQQFTQAAVNSMGDTNPGFSGFMNNFMGQQDRTDPRMAPPIDPTATMSGPPPEPVNSKQYRSERSQVPNNRPDISFSRGDGIDISNQEENIGFDKPERSAPRREMKGPTNIDGLLSGLKGKSQQQPQQRGQSVNIKNNDNDGSTISIQELKEISDAKMDGRSKRRQKSNKNSVSLDI